MKIIKQNQINTVPFRLGEKVTLTATSVYYLFKLTNPQTRESIYFTGVDISTSPSIWNEFQIIETGSTFTNLTASTISLQPTGWWNYEVHQQTIENNLDPELASGLIEVGKIKVSGDTVPFGTSYTYSGENNTRTVYYSN